MSFVKSACPPTSFVINSVFRPWRLAYKAADRPAEAPPMIMTSHCSNKCGIETSVQRSHTIKIITLPNNSIQLQKNMYTAARLIIDYELYFWDTIYKYSITSK
jgi:hypothetical protein